jgi:hypothetical protein
MATVPVSQSYSGVLIASADTGLREKIVATLNTNHWPVMSALGGADALGKLESSDCDVLLLDRRLPDLDADELIATVREQFPGVEVLEVDSKTGICWQSRGYPFRVWRAHSERWRRCLIGRTFHMFESSDRQSHYREWWDSRRQCNECIG